MDTLIIEAVDGQGFLDALIIPADSVNELPEGTFQSRIKPRYGGTTTIFDNDGLGFTSPAEALVPVMYHICPDLPVNHETTQGWLDIINHFHLPTAKPYLGTI